MMLHREHSRIDLPKRNTRFLMLAWSMIIAASLGWTLYYQNHNFETGLHSEAASIHAMDMEYRNWIIHTGGIFGLFPKADELAPLL